MICAVISTDTSCLFFFFFYVSFIHIYCQLFRRYIAKALRHSFQAGSFVSVSNNPLSRTHTHIYYKSVLGSKTHFGLFILRRCSEDIKKKIPEQFNHNIYIPHEGGWISAVSYSVSLCDCNYRRV